MFVKLLFLCIVACAQGLTVRTYVCVECPPCDAWLRVVGRVSSDFPSVRFEKAYGTAYHDNAVEKYPSTIADGVGEFTYPKREDYLRRWLLDLQYNRSSWVVRHPGGNWDAGLASSIHILSREYSPDLERAAPHLPGTGLAWSYADTRFKNTVIIKRVDGFIQMEHDVSSMEHLVRRLLPPLVPLSLANMSNGLEILNFFEHQVWVIFPGGGLTWTTLPRATAWVLFEGTEYPDLVVPSVMTFRRSVEFTYKGAMEEEKVLEWYAGVSEGTVAPSLRKSAEPDDGFSVSGAALSSWLGGDTVLCLYDDDKTLARCREVLAGVERARGFDVVLNDHESLPETARAGHLIHYKDARVVTTTPCTHNALLTFMDRHGEL